MSKKRELMTGGNPGTESAKPGPVTAAERRQDDVDYHNFQVYGTTDIDECVKIERKRTIDCLLANGSALSREELGKTSLEHLHAMRRVLVGNIDDPDLYADLDPPIAIAAGTRRLKPVLAAVTDDDDDDAALAPPVAIPIGSKAHRLNGRSKREDH